MAKGKVEIQVEYCKGCGLCVAVCPVGALRMADTLSPLGVNPATCAADADCTLCQRCAAMCPEGAIRLIRLSEPKKRDAHAAAATRSREGDDA